MFRVLAALIAVCVLPTAGATPAPTYPAPPQSRASDTYFGTVVNDPYRPLETLDAPATMAWARSEGVLARRMLDAAPDRTVIARQYRRLDDYVKLGSPARAGRRWYFERNTGLQTQSPIFVRNSEFGRSRLFFDPNTLSRDGSIQLADYTFPRDGSLMAYATQTGGADWLTWRVKSTATGRDLPDVLRWSKYSTAAWDGPRGFYYSGYDAPRGPSATLATVGAHKVWYHRIGTPQRRDRLVYAERTDAQTFVNVVVSEDERITYLERGKGTGNSLAWKYTREPDRAYRAVFGLDPSIAYTVLGNDGTRVFVQTNRGAARSRVVALDLADPAHRLRTIVPEARDALSAVSLIGDHLYLAYLHDAYSVIRIADTHGRARGTLALPGIGSATLPAGHRYDRYAYYGFSSFAVPGTTFRYDTRTGTATRYHRSAIAFDSGPFITEQIFATSRDGTRVPVFVTHRREMPLDGSTKTLLYGYGGFDIAITPNFSREVALWLQRGGAYAVATLRGGSEYGEAWHDAGRLAHKQHVFDDFIAAAQSLIDRKIASPRTLAINGGSNGGLLVGAVLVQRPDLFGAAIAEQGLFDMLRYERFTVGRAWIPEYGSAAASAAQFRTLDAYSPLHNVRPGTAYPPTLITTADHDDRVFPAHSYKFVAALQAAQSGNAPILLRVQTNEGHFSGLTTDQQIALVADKFAFLDEYLGAPRDVPTAPPTGS